MMKIYKLLLVTFLASLLSMFVQAQTKRALLIGIGQYPSYTGWNTINGDRDIKYVQEYLRTAHFSNIKTLINSQATKSNIVAAFNALKNSCKNGDIVYIHFSGHGQQMKDVNGDEGDGLDESWIPYDACKQACARDRGEKHLVDDEINHLLANISNKVGTRGKVLVVADACHSGSSDNGNGDGSVIYRGTPVIFQSSYYYQGSRTQPDKKWILISACTDSQRNAEMRSPKVGKLTYALYNVSKNIEGMSNQQLKSNLRDFFTKRSRSTDSPQTPNINNMSSFTISEVWTK